MGKISSDSVSHIKERGYEPKELSIPCFRCGVCCTKYQVRINLTEAQCIANDLGISLGVFFERYVGQRWYRPESFLLRHCNGACVFLEHTEGSNKTSCLISSGEASNLSTMDT